jgi:NAD(P)-dependent dehydrogenase (short-subunit alcohol dehydrogenase family)
MVTKIALVTGGSRSLGRDMAISLAKKNIDVVLTYKDSKEAAKEVVKEIKALGRNAVALQFDQSDVKSVDPFLEELRNVLLKEWNSEKFDFLINNAGIGAMVPIPQVTEEIFDLILNTNFRSIYFLTQKALPMMNDNGSVIFISTGTTRFSIPGYSVYASLKGAMEIFSKYVAKEFGNRGIRSNVVAPGPVETDFNDAMIRNTPQLKAYLSSITSLGRVGQADDIGSVVAFLCTDDAKWINAQRIEVSGGINL